jgi:hypothetical protein
MFLLLEREPTIHLWTGTLSLVQYFRCTAISRRRRKLNGYRHELTTPPNGKYDDQVDAMSQALDWFKNKSTHLVLEVTEYWKQEQEEIKSERLQRLRKGQPVPPTLNVTDRTPAFLASLNSTHLLCYHKPD